MKLSHVEIRNYKSLYATGAPFELTLGDGVNSIVGPNNAGKSNILRALALALDEDFEFDRKLDMPASMMWSRPVVTLTFHIPGGAPSPEQTLLRRVDDYERAVHPDVKQTYAERGEVRLRASIEGRGDSSGERRRVFVVSGAGNKSLASDDPLLVKALEQLDKCLQFVLVRSGESLESLMQGRFQEVLRTILEDDLREEFEAAESSRMQYVEALRQGILHDLGERIHAELQDLFPEVAAIELEPNVRSLGATLTGMRVTVTDAATTDLAQKGTGVRGGLIVSMLQHLADTSRRSIVFGVEEPEAFLHPAAQEQMRADLEQLALRANVSLLMTSHSPYVVSRQPEAKVFAIAKEDDGRTVLRTESQGDGILVESLGGLFRDSLVVNYLERAAHLSDGSKAILVVEGETDRFWLRLAAERSGRPELLDDLSIVTAGDGLGHETGGASLVVMQALVLQGTADADVAVLVDDDEHGKECLDMLRKIGNKTGYWKLGRHLYSYRMGIPNGESSDFAYEAEDLWPDELHTKFLDQFEDENTVLAGKSKRPNPHGGWHYDYTANAKGQFADFTDSHARAADCELWVDMIETVRKGLKI